MEPAKTSQNDPKRAKTIHNKLKRSITGQKRSIMTQGDADRPKMTQNNPKGSQNNPDLTKKRQNDSR